MFDIGFMELLLVGVVALVVVGPERLPGLARTAGAWVGRARSFIGNVKADIDRELKAEELKRIIEEQQKSNPLESIIEDTGDSLAQIRKDVEGVAAGMKDASPKND
ncbi:MAG: Sec-independent protein translocase protein TatB [Gammaproteobacteria bacterium]|nr:Sec-independent protein translocase protein TatB [Gammaproteobacteria bacterium]MBU1653885.1 Sec-independent protein translocase protein TatB [Gammaproteobacteria bacterium]MBU1962597.1 Sec-independent protein translocase protein TatB [Gammaproteobacteria bacterium]